MPYSIYLFPGIVEYLFSIMSHTEKALETDDVREMVGKVLVRLDGDILLGFHAHNNIQMAYTNVIAFVDLKRFELSTSRMRRD